MRIALIADTFPPLRTSGAVQLRDLARQIGRMGHEITVLVSSPDLACPWELEKFDTFSVLRLRAPRTKGVGYARRTINEFLMPFAMLRNLKSSPIALEEWDGIVWYSPTVFLGPIVASLKKKNACRSYLIVRDIFPEWAVDMGLMGRGIPYSFFKIIAKYQYSLADVIGIQTQGNEVYFQKWLKRRDRRLEVLNNWIAKSPQSACSIDLSQSALRDRFLFVYAGNMGVAQGMDSLLRLAESLRDRADIGFVFVGRGSESTRLRDEAKRLELANVLFYDEIDAEEIPGLYSQCKAGLLALDQKHKSHNIPGKFLPYMQAGLPVLSVINPGNDLVELIRVERVGCVITETSADQVSGLALELIDKVRGDKGISSRCKSLAENLFSVDVAAEQVISGLQR